MGQVFVYVFASMIFMIVLIYGYRGIQKFQENSDYVAMIELKTKLRSTVNSIASSNSLERVSLRVPDSLQRICFIDLRKDSDDPSDFATGMYPPGVCDEYHSDYNMKICNSWKDKVQKNVFFIPSNNLQVMVGDISLYNLEGKEAGSLCVNVTQQVIYLELKGEGDATGIRLWSPTG